MKHEISGEMQKRRDELMSEIKTTSKGHQWEVGETTAKDLATGLVWNLKDEEGFFTYDEAMKRFGAQLPTIEEYILAKDHGCREVLKFKQKWYWSASVYSNVRAYAWIFHGAHGNVGYAYRSRSGYAVRCVGR